MYIKDTFLRRYFYFLSLLYIATGLYGSIWVLDTFSKERLFLVTFVTIPCLFLIALGFLTIKNFAKERSKIFLFLGSLTFLSLSWNQIVLLNAISGDKKSLVIRNVGSMAMNMEAKRGGFGFIYSTRW